MKAVEQLVERRNNSTIGNHRVIVFRTERHFLYYQTVICVAEDTKLQFMLDNGGYWTSSTRRALSAYRKEFFNQGYTEKLEAEIVKKKRNGLFEAVDQIGATWLLDPVNFPEHTLAKGLKFKADAQHEINAITMVLEEAVV